MNVSLQNPMSSRDILGLRHELQWTQATMSQYFRVTPRTISNWETGETDPNEYQWAALQILRNQLKIAKEKQVELVFRKQLQEQLPSILFGIGVAALFIFLLSRNDD